MAQDADAMSESSWTALAKGKERDWWSIDLEGEMEKLEVVGPWSGTEGGSVDPEGKMGHRSARTKITKEESAKPKEAEMEVDGTQDYVRETLAFSQEEVEEMGFVPRALGEPRGATWLLKKVVKPTQSICVSSAAMKSWRSRATCH